MNEEGTVAAAVTSVTARLTSVQQPREKFVMKVDRPFFFAIRDNFTGVVLFMGFSHQPGLSAFEVVGLDVVVVACLSDSIAKRELTTEPT